MKKSLLSILALAVFATGCQNYDDQFDSLNKQITALTSKVDGLNPATAADISAITGSLTTLKGLVDAMTAQNATDLAGVLAKIAEVTAALDALDTKVATDIAGVETSVASVTAALGDTASSEDVAALSAVTDLQVELDAIKAALDGLLSAGASLKRDISITNAAELGLAESLIDATSTADYIIEGNVLITATAAASYDNDLAAATTRISALTAKIQTVLGAVTATTASSSVALNMDKLTYVKEELNITGKLPTVAALATTGYLILDTDDATYSLPTLVSAGPITIDISTVVSVTSIQLANVTSTDGAITSGTSFVAVDADVNLGKAGLPATVTVKSLTGGGATYTSGTISTTGGDVNLSAATVSGSIISSTGNITLSGATALDSSTLAAGGNITVAAAAVAGTGYVEATAGSGGTVNLSGATATGAASMNAATVSLTAAGGTILLSALKQNVTSLDLNATSIDLSALESATGVLTVVSATTLSFPALTNAAANGIIGADVTNISAPLLALTALNTVNIASDSTHEYLSIALADAAATLSLITSDVSVLTLKAQAGTYSFTTDGDIGNEGDWNRLKTLNITGKANASPASQANNIYVGAANASLTTITMGSDSWINSFVSDNSPMTTLTTGGRIRSFSVSGTALTSLSFNHVEVTPGDASSILIANTQVTSVDMSNSAIKTDYIYISDNASLTSVTMPAETNLPEPTAAISITIHDNALTGAWTAAVSGTGTTAYAEGSFSTTTPTGIVNLSKYVSALASQTGRTGALEYGVEIDDASAAMTTNQAISKILSGNGTQVHYSILASAIANGVEVIDTADELALLPN
jgi:PBP1b-binding outer membrane lipoprotein LpoB